MCGDERACALWRFGSWVCGVHPLELKMPLSAAHQPIGHQCAPWPVAVCATLVSSKAHTPGASYASCAGSVSVARHLEDFTSFGSGQFSRPSPSLANHTLFSYKHTQPMRGLELGLHTTRRSFPGSATHGRADARHTS